MKKIEYIDANQFLTETEKAVILLKEHMEKLRQEASPIDKLEMLKKIIPQVTDFDELQELQNEKIRLELEVRNCGKQRSMIPDEQRATILSNRNIELTEINKVLAKQKAALNEFVEEMESTLLPLLKNIHALEERKNISHQLDKYSDGTYSYIDFGHSLRLEPMYGLPRGGVESIALRSQRIEAANLIEILKGYSLPRVFGHMPSRKGLE